MHDGATIRYTQPPRRALGILVADDELGVRDVVDAALRRAGFAVWLTVDGRQAVEVFQSNHEAIDAALLDVNMPHLDGPQAFAALREIAPRLPCCFMSGGLGAHAADDLSRRSTLELLMKPFTFAAVIRTVRQLVRTGESSAPAYKRRLDSMTPQSLQLDVRGVHGSGAF